MKNIFSKALLTLVFALIFVISCKNYTLRRLPGVVSPEYAMYSIPGERGYTVSFGLEGKKRPVAVVLNKIRQDLTPEDQNGNQYYLSIIAETRLLQNHTVTGSQQENGIIFLVNGKEVLKPVNFKRITVK